MIDSGDERSRLQSLIERRDLRRLAAIVESSDDAIISKDLNGIVITWNRAAERMFGYAAEEMIGRSIRTIIPDDRQGEEDDVLAHIRRAERVDHFETIRRRKDGSLLPISLTVSPIKDDDGTIIGASKIARDITERKQAEAERARLLAMAEQRAALLEKLNVVGAVVASTHDRDTIVQAVTDAARNLTGAAFAAFLYNESGRTDESFALYAVAGAAREAFSETPLVWNRETFEATFNGYTVVRSDDVNADARYGEGSPFRTMLPASLEIRSYLAVPVRARSGAPLGGLFFGHPDAGRFTGEHERAAIGLALWASVALENARLYVGVQEASRLKDEFLATLSHELRTPLNAILGYSRMVRSGIVSGEKQGRAIEIIERNGTSLTQIVEDVLDVSRIVAGQMRLNVQSVDVPAVVQHALEAVLPAAEAKGVRVETLLDPSASPISGDPERLQQVIWNLLSNAVKFTGRGGVVQVMLRRVDSNVEIVVNDTGIGIAPEFLPHVFERFRQADSGTRRQRGGLGLGLAIARELTEMHGGTIQAESGGPGKGATMRLTLPIMMVRTQPEGSAAATGQAQPPERRIAIPNLKGVRVLAVDDDRDALGMVREILEAAGADVSVARSAREALEMMPAQHPAVMVVDLGMPMMDGFELIAEVRRNADSELRQVPAAALTAYARSEDRVRALRDGFQMHLAKPIDPSELMAAVATLANRPAGT